MDAMNMEKVKQIIDRWNAEKGALIQILLDVQHSYHWIPPEAAILISERIDVPLTQVYRVASFYKSLSLTPRGKHLAKICLGTACYVRGGKRIMNKATQVLGIAAGGTTADMKFTLEKVNCLGCCALGPMITVDDKYYGKASPAKLVEVLRNYD